MKPTQSTVGTGNFRRTEDRNAPIDWEAEARSLKSDNRKLRETLVKLQKHTLYTMDFLYEKDLTIEHLEYLQKAKIDEENELKS